MATIYRDVWMRSRHPERVRRHGGNMCSFSRATGTSRVRHNARYVPYAHLLIIGSYREIAIAIESERRPRL